MNALGIERLCVFGMPPVEFVRLAADLGCDGVGVGLAPSQGYNPHNYPDWSLRQDAGLRHEMVSALHDHAWPSQSPKASRLRRTTTSAPMTATSTSFASSAETGSTSSAWTRTWSGRSRALYERMPPGAGELPLREFVRLLPPDVTISLEIPMRSLADQGVGPRERLAPCVDTAQALLSAVAGTGARASRGR